MSDSKTIYSWWTPTGWLRGPAPAAYWEVEISEDWTTALINAGYERMRRSSDEFLQLAYEIHVHKDQHLYVEFQSFSSEASFFVAPPHVAAFMLDRYPAMIAAEHAERQADNLEKIATAVVAWIRHGNSPATIDAWGMFTKDNPMSRRQAKAPINDD